MKITVSVNGRFHAFDLAAQLHKHGHLKRLITPYPAFKAQEWGIPKEKIVSLLALEIMKRGGIFLPQAGKRYLSVLQKDLYDRFAARFIPSDTDIFIGWSSNSLHGIRKAKQVGAVTVLERGSSHMLTQLELLREEFNLQGRVFNEHHPAITEKELKEYEEADYISIPSHFVKRTFLKHGISEEKLIHIPYGVDLTDFRPVQKEDKIFRIIYCGGLTLQKGVHYLIQAFCELNLPDTELWLLGGGGEEIHEFLKRYDKGKVKLKGHQPQNQLHWFYSQSNVYCQPSIQDGFGMVIPQAMACGLPIICTINTGGEDLIKDGKEGFVIPIRDVTALKDKILYLYEHQDICREMGQSAKEKVSRGFTWDNYGRKIIDGYQRILDAKR